MKKEILLIVQSPIGIASILQIYKDKVRNEEITIICIGSLGLHKYLQGLKLKCKLYFIKPVAYSDYKVGYLKRLMNQRVLIKKTCNKWKEIYFSSTVQDLYTITLINECKKDKVKLYKIETGLNSLVNYSTKLNFKHKLIEIFIGIMIKIATGVTINTIYLSGRYIYSYRNSDEIINIDVKLSPEIYEDYGVNISGDLSYNILLLESLGDDSDFYCNYQNQLLVLVNKLLSNGTVYVKGHPTYGLSKILRDDKRLKYLDQSIPAAMINLKNFSLIVGIESAALKEFRHQNIVSVIDSFEVKDEAIKQNFKNYLREGLDNKIKFRSINELSFV
jgi:hypothetical protein